MKNVSIIPILLLIIHGLFFFGVFRDDINESDHFGLGRQAQFRCVGSVFVDGKMKSSCVLVNKTYVLLAAHSTYFARKQTGENPGLSFQFEGLNYSAKRLIYPGRGNRPGEHDIVIAELDRPVAGISPAVINRSFNELGHTVVGVGFGSAGKVTSKGFLKNETEGKKNAGENIIDSIGGVEYNGSPSVLFFDFDSPGKPLMSRMGGAKPLELEYCPTGGDSGGGLFMHEGGLWKLVGICHGTDGNPANFMKNGYYGDVAQWTRVSVFAGWIEGVMGELPG